MARLVRQAGRAAGIYIAAVAQLVERVLGKDEVMGSSPISSYRLCGWQRDDPGAAYRKNARDAADIGK